MTKGIWAEALSKTNTAPINAAAFAGTLQAIQTVTAEKIMDRIKIAGWKNTTPWSDGTAC